MTKNVTLRIDESLIKECRHIAVEENKSFSQWVVDMITETVGAKRNINRSRKSALARLDKGLTLTGSKFVREEAYER
ncbi:MAG: transcriptional regulator [Fibrobacteres bacterium]|nr:transcriptional regulator [Fibrobacterota bacterium]